MTASDNKREQKPPPKISLVLSDVDGTLVTKDKRLTSATIDAVQELRRTGIAFAITSSRPPRGLLHLVEPLNLTTPISGFNSGMVMDHEHRVLREQRLESKTTRKVIELLDASGVDIWVFSGNDWLVRDLGGDYVEHERKTIGYDPIRVENFEATFENATKIVGVSLDFARLAECEGELRSFFGADASISLSQRYYLDITHVLANKGSAVLSLAELLSIPRSEIATIGDMSNDVRMFEKSGFSIAMGNASDAVKARAHVTTESNEQDGFAKAMKKYIIPSAPAA